MDHLNYLLARADLVWCAPSLCQNITPFVLEAKGGYLPGLLQDDGQAFILNPEPQNFARARDMDELASGEPPVGQQVTSDEQGRLIWQSSDDDMLVAFVIQCQDHYIPRLLTPGGRVDTLLPQADLPQAKISASLAQLEWRSDRIEKLAPAQAGNLLFKRLREAADTRPARDTRSVLDCLSVILAWRGTAAQVGTSTIEPLVLRDHKMFRSCLLLDGRIITALPPVAAFETAVEQSDRQLSGLAVNYPSLKEGACWETNKPG